MERFIQEKRHTRQLRQSKSNKECQMTPTVLAIAHILSGAASYSSTRSVVVSSSTGTERRLCTTPLTSSHKPTGMKLLRIFLMKTAEYLVLFLVYKIKVFGFLIPTKQSCIVIGGSGTLGLEISELLSGRPDTDWKSSFRRHETRERDALNKMKRGCAFELELLQTEFQMPTFLQRDSQPAHYILFNCAGVCLPGSSVDVMERSLKINTIGPCKLTQLAIRKLSGVHGNGDLLSVVNVSSGDGELSFLHTRIAERIKAIRSVVQFEQFVEELLRTFDPNTEYAHGSTPMYSISKALLNKYTQLMHQDSHSKDAHHVRVLACCPGNVASPMSTEDELLTTLPARHAAEQILHLATNFEAYPGGKFYRNCQEIPW